MTSFKVDFDQKSGADVPPGDYAFQVDSIEEVPGNVAPQLVVKMTIQGGEFDGIRFTDWISLSDKASWRLAQFVRAAGVNGKGEQVVDASHMVGKIIPVKLGYEKDQKGEEWLRVKRYLKPKTNGPKASEGGGPAEADKSTAKKSTNQGAGMFDQ